MTINICKLKLNKIINWVETKKELEFANPTDNTSIKLKEILMEK